MHPEEIKAALRIRGWSQVRIASDLNVTPASVHQVITGRVKSIRIREFICRILEKPVDAIWPLEAEERQAPFSERAPRHDIESIEKHGRAG
ncbi:transcriptional regulator [Corticibacter populi]|uniref:Transcriptional regulator n=1 Tax=Corticibacter populi TaxID=1550736 RepID=A0A3M6QZE4_9BURK|nr:helix-turn-helix domain-containing protein [Corticibacter populi]RMX08380.1 transcriptional regulator [Corticibacter populi]RZS35681.1 DNA-binding XRE family transcriptional regulator [Corticibacter populi]